MCVLVIEDKWAEDELALLFEWISIAPAANRFNIPCYLLWNQNCSWKTNVCAFMGAKFHCIQTEWKWKMEKWKILTSHEHCPHEWKWFNNISERRVRSNQIKSNINNSVFVIKMYKCEFAPPTSLMRNVEFNFGFFSVFLLFFLVKLKSGLYGM